MRGRRKGYGIVEVVITLGLVSLIIVSIGRLLISANELDKASQEQTIALALLQEPMEIISANIASFYMCDCTSSEDCTNCPCATLPGYASCWMDSPTGNFELFRSGVYWSIVALEPDEEEKIDGHPQYSRVINIINAKRDGNGNITDSGGTVDPSTKIVTITVKWQSKQGEKERSLQKIFTAWQDF